MYIQYRQIKIGGITSSTVTVLRRRRQDTRVLFVRTVVGRGVGWKIAQYGVHCVSRAVLLSLFRSEKHDQRSAKLRKEH